MVTPVHKQDGSGHGFHAGILLYLACIAVCGIFFSLGFVVGYNERGSHSAATASTEEVTAPSAVPPTINAPAESNSQLPAPDASSANSQTSAEPETEVIGSTPAEPAAPLAEEHPKSAAGKKHKEEAEQTPAPAQPDQGEAITLQVAALRTRQDAETMVSLLKARGYRVFMVPPQKGHAENSLYRVEVGPYHSRAEADKAKNKLVQDGFKPFVKH